MTPENKSLSPQINDRKAREVLTATFKMTSELKGLGINPYTPEEAEQVLLSGGLLGERNIHTFAYGPKKVDGEVTDEEAVIFMVTKKAPPEKVEPEFLVEKLGERFFPGFKTDVWQNGPIDLLL